MVESMPHLSVTFCATGNGRNLALAPDNYIHKCERIRIRGVCACVGGQLFSAAILAHVPDFYKDFHNGDDRYKSILSRTK